MAGKRSTDRAVDLFNRRQVQLLLKAKFVGEPGGVRRPRPDDVDVTLTHNGNVIHVNDSRGRRTAREYLKAIQP